MSFETLIIFDYSGTLSTESVLFGRPECLQRELDLCGLAELGVGDVDVFWEQIVNPTWHKGSSTPCGYREVMQEAIERIQPQPISPALRDRIASSVEVFVGSYFTHSRIDERWRPLLLKLGRNETVKVIIATDHYAEATGVILRCLADWRIKANSAWEAWTGGSETDFLVANSADIGVYKSDPDFWRIIKRDLKSEAMSSILVIDDFGFNERREDRYGDIETVEARKEKTIKLLGTVFAEAAVEPVAFFLPGKRNGTASAHDAASLFGPLIAGATAEIECLLARRKE